MIRMEKKELLGMELCRENDLKLIKNVKITMDDVKSSLFNLHI